MRASIWSLRPLERTTESRHFTDAEQPDWEGVTLTLSGMNGTRATRYAVLKADLLRSHVTGLRDGAGDLVLRPDGRPLQPPEPVLCQDFSRRTPDELLIDRYAKMAAMWAGGDDDPCPPLSEMVGWQALLYLGWLEIANWIEERYVAGLLALEQEGAAPGNSPQAPPEAPGPPISGSSAPSSSATTSTLRSPPAATISSAPSSAPPGVSLLSSTPPATETTFPSRSLSPRSG